MFSFREWVKSRQQAGTGEGTEKASRAAAGANVRILIHRVCLCPVPLAPLASESPYTPHNK